MAWNSWRNWLAPLSGVLSVLVSAGVSYWVAVATISPIQDRQMRIDKLDELATSSNQLLGLGAQVVVRLASEQGFDDLKGRINEASANQSAYVAELPTIFGRSVGEDVESYQMALGDFIKSTNAMKGPQDFKRWSVSFDGVVNATDRLKREIRPTIGVAAPIDSN